MPALQSEVMSLPKERHRPLEGASYGEMRVLAEIERMPDISQRNLARRVGVSLTLTNHLLHNLAQKGYIRITRASWRGWLYTLTPSGFSRKVQLTLSYVNRFLGHYQRVRQTIREELEPLGLNPESRLAIYCPVLEAGERELAELAYLGLKELGVEEVDVFVTGATQSVKFLGQQVHAINAFRQEHYDHVVFVCLKDSEATWVELRDRGIPGEKLVTLFNGAKF